VVRSFPIPTPHDYHSNRSSAAEGRSARSIELLAPEIPAEPEDPIEAAIRRGKEAIASKTNDRMKELHDNFASMRISELQHRLMSSDTIFDDQVDDALDADDPKAAMVCRGAWMRVTIGKL
jgi:hypothetical protein